MELQAHTEYFSLADEKFDFDVSLSPASSKEDEVEEDEVFVGPVGHRERCVSVGVERQVAAGEPGWSPLPGEQFDSISQEAEQLANQLRSNVAADKDTEDFVQEAEAKLGMLSQAAGALSPIKRETFCVQDSPMKQLPPAIQQRLLKAAAAAPGTKPRLSTSSPVRGARLPANSLLRERAGLSVGTVLPSRPAAPPTSSSKSRATSERSCRQPPSKVAPPRPASRAASCDDLLSDSASVASDVSDSSLNSSLPGRRALAPPTKSRLRNPPAVKAPPPQSKRASDRRKTSSSSSSVSSFNSSLSCSPAAKGKLNSSLNTSVPPPAAKAPSSLGRPANPGAGVAKPRLPPAERPAGSGGAAAGRRSLSVQARKPSEVGRSTPLKPSRTGLPHPAPALHTPAKTATQRSGSLPSMPCSASSARLHSNNKPKVPVAPTPSGPIRAVSSPDAARSLKPKRLMAASSPLRSAVQAADQVTPPAGGSRSLQCKARRASALPTPLSRRTSCIPTRTPGSLARPVRAGPAPSSARTPTRISLLPVAVQPFSLEEAEPPAPAASPDAGRSFRQDSPEPATDLIELQSAEGAEPQAQDVCSVEGAEPRAQDAQKQDVIEVLLLDLPAPTLQPQEKLLIDLRNTPELIRTARPCGGGGALQLIDLSSPLIKWSPEDRKENVEAPLINLSF
ncbi:G2 and S phase-expressed protein 1 isoform X2 [Myripristis murdjan]|uniref:G2 and S phase-expressed protein 1 isoform X2 n=1 Tax=Myripristis murdjan TaxID=586833 RepID=UPI0011760D7A|nr:G2 and S phase-expressed protein 1-like isoform X2 [Myripristis murdjan]